MTNENEKNVSRAANDANIPRRATVIDTGMQQNATAVDRAGPRRVTEVDTGTRRRETVIDTGTRRRETVIDTGAQRRATVVDTGINGAAMLSIPDPSGPNVGGLMGRWQRVYRFMRKNAGQNMTTFSSLEVFKNIAGNLQELQGASGKKYKTRGTLSREGGQAALLLCTDTDGHDVVAKLYFNEANSSSTYEARGKLYQYLDSHPDQHYILPVLDLGAIPFAGRAGVYFFEILPYCQRGNLEDTHRPFDWDELVPIIKKLNEALHTIHRAGILHLDLKPANIYYYQDHVVIGDFGVASINVAHVTKFVARTEGYAAPETLIGVGEGYYYDERCDYYSLGVTLASLYEGRYIYENMEQQMPMCVHNSQLPITRRSKGVDQLKNLFDGLYQFDPQNRFGYEDVCKWLQNPSYAVKNNAQNTAGWPKPFNVSSTTVCKNERELFNCFAGSVNGWEIGKQMLYKKYVEKFFSTFRPDLALHAQRCDENWRTVDPDKGLAEFLRELWPEGPIAWKGATYQGLSSLGEAMMTADDAHRQVYGHMLKRSVISAWVRQQMERSDEANRQTHEKALQIVESIEKYNRQDAEKSNADTTYVQVYWFGFSFAPQRRLRTAAGVVKDIRGLFSALFGSAERFYQSGDYECLMDREYGAALYGFLYSFGYKDLLDTVWNTFRSNTGEDQRFTVLLAALEKIGQQSGVGEDALQSIRRFYREFGPLGIAQTTVSLLKDGRVYKTLDSTSDALCAKITAFEIPADKSIQDTQNACEPLFQYLVQFRKALSDNPFCIAFGVFEEQGIVCLNLRGSFSFRIFGLTAPLAFAAYIEKGE